MTKKIYIAILLISIFVVAGIALIVVSARLSNDNGAAQNVVESSSVSYPPEEEFYIVALQGMTIAVRQNKARGVYRVPDTNIDIFVEDEKIKAMWGTAELPGYYDSWQSWSLEHQDNGIVF